MSQQNRDVGTLSLLEIEVVKQLRQTNQEGRELTAAVAAMHAQHYPLRQVLHLVKSVS